MATNNDEWNDYKEKVEKLNSKLKSLTRVHRQTAKFFAHVGSAISTSIGGNKIEYDLEKGIIDCILDVEEALLKIREKQIHNGARYGNLIDATMFLQMLDAKDQKYSPERYLPDHFNTLVAQRNAMLARSYNISPLIGILGLALKAATVGAAILMAAMGAIYAFSVFG